MRTLRAITGVLVTFFLLSGTAYLEPLSGTSFAGFTDGSVDGQGGWSSTGSWDEEVTTEGSGPNKVWRVSNAITSGSFGDMPFAPRPGGIPTDTVNDPVNSEPLFFAGESSTGAAVDRFDGKFSFRSVTGEAQPGLRITVSIDNGTGARQSFVALVDTGSGIDIQTVDVDDGGNFSDSITIARGLSYTDWHTVEMQAHFVDGAHNDKVKYIVDSKLVHVGPSWEQFYRNFQSDLHPLGVPVQTLIFRLSGDAAPDVAGDGFYIDNVFTSNSNTGHGD